MSNFVVMKIRFIALRVTRYNDRQNILTAFSRESGRVSLSVPAGRGREAGRLRALSMPLRVVECEVEPGGGREIKPMRQAVAVETGGSVWTHPLKQMMAMFLAEVVGVVTREDGGADRDLYDFLEGSVRVLDLMEGERLGNFHICFLCHLARLMGVEPDIETWREGYLLDMRDGLWRQSMPIHGDALTHEESLLAARLSRITYAKQHVFRFSRRERARTLDLLMRYLSIHLAPLSGVKSLEVLRGMF